MPRGVPRLGPVPELRAAVSVKGAHQFRLVVQPDVAAALLAIVDAYALEHPGDAVAMAILSMATTMSPATIHQRLAKQQLISYIRATTWTKIRQAVLRGIAEAEAEVEQLGPSQSVIDPRDYETAKHQGSM